MCGCKPLEIAVQTAAGKGDGTRSLMTLNDLLKEEIQDLYSAEQQIEKALPAMAAKANLSITPDAKMLEIALA
jgi:hypothetical protein